MEMKQFNPDCPELTLVLDNIERLRKAKGCLLYTSSSPPCEGRHINTFFSGERSQWLQEHRLQHKYSL